jgi:hypothetical protein
LRAYVGDFDKAAHRFHPEKLVRMNWPGGMLFAGESLESPDGRRIFWVMIHDPRTGPSQHATGRNSMTLPRVLDICAKWCKMGDTQTRIFRGDFCRADFWKFASKMPLD